MNCPNCGEEVRDEDALFCQYCANRLKLPKKRSGFQIAAGVLTIIGACISISIGLLWLVAFAMYFRAYSLSSPTSYFLVMGIFNIIAFALGLMSGIFTLRRKHFALSMIGVSLVLVSGFVIIRSFEAMEYEALMGYLVFGAPVVILSLLGLIFAAISRSYFV